MKVDLKKIAQLKQEIAEKETELLAITTAQLYCLRCGETDTAFYPMFINGGVLCLTCDKELREMRVKNA